MHGILKGLTMVAVLVGLTTAAAAPVKTYTSKPFAGAKANTGTVTATVDNGKIVVKRNSVTEGQFNLGSVNAISIDAKAGNDKVTVAGSISKPATINGGAGNDELTGGSGADKYRFDTALNAATNVDDLLGYSGAADTILLDRDIFTGIAANGVLAASAFVNGTSAGDANDRIIYNSATGNIFYDADGNGAGAQIRFATVAAGTSLTSADFSAYL